MLKENDSYYKKTIVIGGGSLSLGIVFFSYNISIPDEYIPTKHLSPNEDNKKQAEEEEKKRKKHQKFQQLLDNEVINKDFKNEVNNVQHLILEFENYINEICNTKVGNGDNLEEEETKFIKMKEAIDFVDNNIKQIIIRFIEVLGKPQEQEKNNLENFQFTDENLDLLNVDKKHMQSLQKILVLLKNVVR